MMGLLDLWRRLPAWVRFPIALGILAWATYLFLHPAVADAKAAKGIGMLYVIGLLLLCIGPTDAQKKGYHD